MIQASSGKKKNTGKGVAIILERATRRRTVAFERAQVFQQHLFKVSLQLVNSSQNS
jgi:hypothetical protein